MDTTRSEIVRVRLTDGRILKQTLLEKESRLRALKRVLPPDTRMATLREVVRQYHMDKGFREELAMQGPVWIDHTITSPHYYNKILPSGRLVNVTGKLDFDDELSLIQRATISGNGRPVYVSFGESRGKGKTSLDIRTHWKAHIMARVAYVRLNEITFQGEVVVGK